MTLKTEKTAAKLFMAQALAKQVRTELKENILPYWQEKMTAPEGDFHGRINGHEMLDPEALKAGAGLSAAAANLAAAGQAAAQAQLALEQLQNGTPLIDPNQIKATDPATVEEAIKNYTEELAELTEVFSRVKKQAERMTTDSEEMENLNRSITGIATVYELQLRNISKQVSTIEQIDEQTRRMAQQIEELNNVYARMINALTINMNGVAGTPANEK
mgnify:CR=1 FL=1